MMTAKMIPVHQQRSQFLSFYF